MSDTCILELKNLDIGYTGGRQSKVICRNLSGRIHAGELVCLLGENGIGKSTLIRTLCHFQPALKGEISIVDNNLTTLNERELSKLVSVVLTDRIIIPNATVRELVGLGRSPFTGMFGKLGDDDRKLVNQAIKQCGIEHKSDEFITNLSDGERQKVFIAKALSQDTPIIILDEPTAFLDLSARVEILQLLRKIATSSQKSILLSTHDLDLAMQMADKLWLLSSRDGLLSGSPEDLIINNAFKEFFSSSGVAFDAKTGLFKVKYKHSNTIAVKGHGFEYVLLRRAFARRAIEIVHTKDNNVNTYLEIQKNDKAIFNLITNNKIVASSYSIDEIVKITLSLINNEKAVDN